MNEPVSTPFDPLAPSVPVAESPRAETIKVAAFNPSELPEIREGRKLFTVTVVTETFSVRNIPCTERVFDEVAGGRLDFDKRSDFLLSLVDGVVTEITRMDKPSSMPAFNKVQDGDSQGIDGSLVVVKVAADSRVSVASQPGRMSPGALDAILRSVRTGLDTLRPGTAIEGGLVTEIRSLAGGTRLFLVRP